MGNKNKHHRAGSNINKNDNKVGEEKADMKQKMSKLASLRIASVVSLVIGAVYLVCVDGGVMGGSAVSKKEEDPEIERQRKLRNDFVHPNATGPRKVPDWPTLSRDYRPYKCPRVPEKAYSIPEGTRISIVIPYLNEDKKHVLGTLGSIMDNTPEYLVEEVIFISDGNSDETAYQEEIEEAWPGITRVIRLPERNGLIVAKNLGAHEAKGDVIMFFEPHCIVHPGWLEPLLANLAEHPNSLLLPALDIIPANAWGEYHVASPGSYRFEWNFNLAYTNHMSLNRDTYKPFYVPATSGGIFVIRTERFKELKLFNTSLKQWGGDQIELSFKAWRCGGSVILNPCSRIGHLFREPVERPYPVDVSRVVHNYGLLANVWLEPPYLEAFYLVKPEARAMVRGVDFSKGKKEIEELGCKSMDWYIKNVDLELGWESDKICIPGAPKSMNGCEGPAAPGRATIDRIMPMADWKQWNKKSVLTTDPEYSLTKIGGAGKKKKAKAEEL